MALLSRIRRLVDRALATPRRLFLALGLAIALAAGGGFLFAWSGLYDVAASKGHFPGVEAVLRFGMENSVEAHAPDATLPPTPDEDRIRLGAGHFHGGCAFCHGAPGTPISPVAAKMLPPPPDLGDRIGLWRDGELFQIVKHGLKYTGMPGFPVLGRDDEIWAVVAFLRRLPTLDRKGYRALALGEVEPERPSGGELAAGQVDPEATGTCARCHGDAVPPASRLVPILHGQPAPMIANALRTYAAGERDSGIMQAVAAALSEAEIVKLAAHYAAKPLPPSPPQDTDREAAARGAILARDGIPAQGIPSCLACHDESASPLFPRLAGQPARYLEGQLAVWRSGLNDRSATGQIMAGIARRLDARQAHDLAAYFAGLPREVRQ